MTWDVMVLGLITLLRVAVLIALSSLICGAARRADRPAPDAGRKISPLPSFWPRFRPTCCSGVRHHHRPLPAEPRYLAVAADRVEAPSGTFCSTWWPAPRCPTTIARPPPISHSRLAMVAPGAAGHLPLTSPAPSPRPAALERQHRGRVRAMGSTRVKAHGLGAYIAETTAAGDFPKIIWASP